MSEETVRDLLTLRDQIFNAQNTHYNELRTSREFSHLFDKMSEVAYLINEIAVIRT